MIKIVKNKRLLVDDYEGILFVLKATAPKEKNSYKNNGLQEVMFDGACLWGTDGKRIHYYYLQQNVFKPGVYHVNKGKEMVILEEIDRRFPDVFRLSIFNNSPTSNFKMRMFKEDADRAIQSTEYSKIIKRLDDNYTINMQYFLDLGLGEYTVYHYGSEDAIGFCGEYKGAVIMPMRIKSWNDVG
jgi:hypothetical protein